MKVLVTGVKGQLGYDIYRELRKRGIIDIIAVDKDEMDITDRDKVIAVAGPLKKKYLGKEINEFTERSIERRDSFENIIRRNN